MIKKKKLYVKPRKAYEKSRIQEENRIVEKYGLKNKREIWKTLAKINYFRHRGKELSSSSSEEQEVFFNKLRKIGLNVNTIGDVLALKVQDLLERRLPTIVFKKGYSKTPQEARQMVVHKRVFIEGKIVNVPSYIVSIEDEKSITLKPAKKPKSTEVKE